MAALKYWVWLTTLPGLGTRTSLQLLEHFDSPEDIYYADTERAAAGTRASPSAQAALLADKSLDRAEQVLEDCARRRASSSSPWSDAAYPNRLRSIYDPPMLLYGKGALPAVRRRGGRSPWWAPAPARPTASAPPPELGYEMAKQGALLVSGMATRHRRRRPSKGALRAGGLHRGRARRRGRRGLSRRRTAGLYEDIAAAGVTALGVPAGHRAARQRPLPRAQPACISAPDACHRGGRRRRRRSGALITAHHRAGSGAGRVCRTRPDRRAEASRGTQRTHPRGRGTCVRGVGHSRATTRARFPPRPAARRARSCPPMPEGSEPAAGPDPRRARSLQAERERKAHRLCPCWI